jgi:integrase
MAIYKPKTGKSKNYYIDFIDPNGKRVRQSSGTENKQQAQELHDRLKHEAWRVKNVGDKPRYSWQEAVVRYLGEQDGSKTLENTKGVLRYLNEHLENKMLDEITKSVTEDIRQHKKLTGVKNSTVNRTMTVLRAVLNAAHDWQWLDNVPKIKMFSDDSARVLFLTTDEAGQLLGELKGEVLAMAKFTLATGLRASNVIDLCWSNVDMQKRTAWIDAAKSKSGKAITVPLNDDAMRVLRGQINKHPPKVFDYHQRQLSTEEFTKALKRAGIEDFRWHDLRHTWASWHIQNGTPIHVLKELGGWADLSMVLRYAHLTSEHLSRYANNSAKIISNDKILSYPQKKVAY